MDDETQGNAGILVAKPAPAELSPELKGYGKVLDPTALATLMTELATAKAAATASQADSFVSKGCRRRATPPRASFKPPRRLPSAMS